MKRRILWNDLKNTTVSSRKRKCKGPGVEQTLLCLGTGRKPVGLGPYEAEENRRHETREL